MWYTFDFATPFDFDTLWEKEIHPPTISLNLTPDQLDRAKRYARSRLLQANPWLNSKEERINLSRSEKVDVINKLSRFFEEASENILNES